MAGNVKIESLNCNQCGAPLAVAETANFVTCKHCESQLVVRRTESASSTELLTKLSRSTQRLAEQVADLTLRQELDTLDRAWERERETMLVRYKDGSSHEPSTFFSGLMLYGGGGLIVLGMAGLFAGAKQLPVAALIGLVVSLAGIFHYAKAVNFSAAERRYRQKRTELLATRQPTTEVLSPDAEIHDPQEFLGQLQQDAKSW